MKPHHLDEYIADLEKRVKIPPEMVCEHYILILFKEIKRIDEAQEALADRMHDYQDQLLIALKRQI